MSHTGTSAIPLGTDRARLRGIQLTQMNTADWYRWFATAEARGASPCLEQWALGIADDQSLVALIEELPESKRQPNLVLAVARFAGITPTGFDQFRDQFASEWTKIRSIALERRTQTNEPGHNPSRSVQADRDGRRGRLSPIPDTGSRHGPSRPAAGVLVAREHTRRAVLRRGHDGDDRRSGAMFWAGLGRSAAPTASDAESCFVCFATSAVGLRACSCSCARNGTTEIPQVQRRLYT